MKNKLSIIFICILSLIVVLSCDNPSTNSETEYLSDDGFVFTKDGSTLSLTAYEGNSSTVNIPATYNGINVVEIGDSVFRDKAFITEIVIPVGIVKIGECAFYECTSLTTVTIPEGVKILDKFTFTKSSNLKEVILPSTLEGIEQAAFSWCINLNAITIPDNVTYISHSAFIECDSLVSIVIPSSVNSIGTFAFSFCDILESLKFLGTTPPVIVEDSFTGINGASFNKILVPQTYKDQYVDSWGTITNISDIEIE